MKPEEAREYLQFLLDGLIAFHPEIFGVEAEGKDVPDGWSKEDFTTYVLITTQSKTVSEAKATLEIWLSTPDATRNVPLVIIEAARDAEEVAKAPSAQAQKVASEVLLAKSSNLKAEIEASGQPVLKPLVPSIPTPEAVSPTKPPLAVVGPAHLTPVEEGAVVLRPLRAMPSLSANLESLANQASESHDELREQVRTWIKESFPDFTDDETSSTAERFTTRLEGAKVARPTQVATLKALSQNPQVLSQEERLLATDLAKKAAEIAGRDKEVIEKALAKRISQQEIRQIFEQDNLEYKPESGLAKDTFMVKKEPFFKKAQASAIEGQKVDLKDTVAPAPAAPSVPPAPTKPPIAVVSRAIPSPIEVGAVVLRPIRLARLPQAEVKSLTKEATQKTDDVREKVRTWIKQTFPQTPGEKVRATAERFTQRLVSLEEEKPTDVAALKALVKSEAVAPDVRKKAGMLLEKATALAQEDRKIIEAAASGKISKEAIEQAFAQDEAVYQVVPEIQEKDVLIKAKPFIAKVEDAVVKGQVVEITKEILPASAVLPTQESPEIFYIRPVMRIASAKLPKPVEKSLTSMQDSARQNALNFISELKQQVAQNIPSEVKSVLTISEVEAVSQAAAEEFTQRLLNPDEPTFLDLTSPDNEAAVRRLFVQKEIKEKFQALANQAAVVERANQELMARAVDKEIVDALYESNKIEVLEKVSAEAQEVATADIVSSLDTKVSYVQKSLPAYHLILSENSEVAPHTRAAARLLGIAVKTSPKAQTLAQSTTTKSLKFAIGLGAETLAKTSPDEATALKLLSLGVGSKQVESLLAQAQKLGLEKEAVERLQNLEQIIKALEEARPELLQLASAQGVEIKLLSEYSEIFTSQIVLQPTDSSYVFSPQSFQAGGIQGLAQRLFGRVSSKFLDRIVGPAKEKIFSILGGKAKGQLAKLALGKSLKAGIKGLAVRALTKLGLKGLFTKIGAAIGTALGAVFGPLAPIIGAIVGFLSSFALNALSWLKRKIAENKELLLGLLLLGSGLLVGGPLGLGLVAVGGLTALGAAVIKAAGFGGAVGQAGGVINAAITGITNVALPSIGVPIVVSFISIPVVVAIILFIINSGAYLVPPQIGVSPFTIESAYIGVTKTAKPAGPFQNGDLPINITYTIEVTAKKGTLTNISFDYVCEVIKDGPAPDCPPITPDIPTAPVLISPVEPFTFTYTYSSPISGSSFFDSFVVDTFTVTADSPDKAGDKAASSVSIKIGNPPDECPDGWPIFPSAGEGSLPIIQGPYGISTHNTIEAIDIAASIRHPVRATHSGIGAEGSLGGQYGRHVIISSTCGGKSFHSVYAHLSTIDSKIVSGAAVTKGQTIGLSGITGTDNAHLHYDFGPGATIPMAPPYIPKSVPRGCWNYGYNNLGVGIPCNVNIP